MNIFIFSLCLFILSIVEVFAEDCQSKATLFLNQPTYRNYLRLSSSKESDMCRFVIMRDSHHLAKLYRHTKQGNRWAIKLLIRNLSNLDGGELEDAYRSLGESINAEPRILLWEFKEQRITEDQFIQSVIILPLSFVDNKNGTLKALKNRKNKIRSIKDAKLGSQKKLAVNAINAQINKINKLWP